MIWLTIGTWVLTVVSLIGTALNVKKIWIYKTSSFGHVQASLPATLTRCFIKWCFYLWTVSNILWVAYDLYIGLYSRAVYDFARYSAGKPNVCENF